VCEGSEEIAKPRFESRPGVEYKLWENGNQTRRLSWLQALEGDSELFLAKGSETLILSGVGDLRQDGEFLVEKPGRIAVPGPVRLFFTSCEAMEFAETHRHEERPDLAVSLFMLFHSLRLECEISMELTASSNRSCLYCSTRKSRDQSALSS